MGEVFKAYTVPRIGAMAGRRVPADPADARCDVCGCPSRWAVCRLCEMDEDPS